ncbi:AmmeMemoRadiSam system protein B [Gemmatimonadota bacterium]
MTDIRHPAVAGRFYPGSEIELRAMVEGMLANVDAEPIPAFGAIVPHAGLIYSGECAAHVFKRLTMPPVVVILAPNHTGRADRRDQAAAWDRGFFETPFGNLQVAEEFLQQLEMNTPLVAHDPSAHMFEHAVEVELPFLALLSPETMVAPLVLGWDDWDHCKELADALTTTVSEWPQDVLLIASSDMTHFETALTAARKDRGALDAIERFDGEGLLSYCHRENVSMCGRAPSAVVLEATRSLGATRAEVVDYRHSGLVTGDDSDVVAYAGVLIT